MIQNVQQRENQSSLPRVTTKLVQVLCAADENYAKSLCVTLRTAAEQLRADYQLKAFVIDGGISPESWEKIEKSVSEFQVEIERIQPDPDRVAQLATSHHITHAAYYRLLAAEWLPESVDKVIYLDSDLLICDDLTQLWDLEQKDFYCWAVADVACPYVDAKAAQVNFKKSNPYMAAISPIRNYRELGLDGSAPYFNSGVMVMHLNRWRADGVSEKLLSCLAENEEFVWCWDQYALNVVFAGRWGQLPLRWNQGAHAFEYPSPEHAPCDQSEYLEMIEKPAVIHYTTEWKPWDYVSAHPSHQLFFEKLDDTEWTGWRPHKPKFSIKRTWTSIAVTLTKHWIINYRKVVSSFST